MNKVEPLENEGSSTEPVESASVIEEPNNSIPQPLPPTPNVLISNDGKQCIFLGFQINLSDPKKQFEFSIKTDFFVK